MGGGPGFRPVRTHSRPASFRSPNKPSGLRPRVQEDRKDNSIPEDNCTKILIPSRVRPFQIGRTLCSERKHPTSRLQKNPSVATCPEEVKEQLNFKTPAPASTLVFSYSLHPIYARCKQRAGFKGYFINSITSKARPVPSASVFPFNHINTELRGGPPHRCVAVTQWTSAWPALSFRY
jgi:hypothetical protein